MKRRARPVVLALLIVAIPARTEPVFRLHIETDARSTKVAANRLHAWLEQTYCPASLSFTGAGEQSLESQSKSVLEADLIFRLDRRGQAPVLAAVNGDGQYPVPVWVTRQAAGVRSLAQLQGRDVSLIDSKDPVGLELPLRALAAHGVKTKAGQRYLAGDFSSALGLLLHNNTHAAASELGLVRPMLDSQGLAVTWQGEPAPGAGWYRPEDADNSPLAEPCISALQQLQREDDRQIFRIFPEWVHRFAAPESIVEKEPHP